MKLLKFTRTGPAGAEVAINPEHVAAVTTHSGKTVIQLVAPDKDGSLCYYVTEEFSYVVSYLQGIATL